MSPGLSEPELKHFYVFKQLFNLTKTQSSKYNTVRIKNTSL